jgi:hypothetical protein
MQRDPPTDVKQIRLSLLLHWTTCNLFSVVFSQSSTSICLTEWEGLRLGPLKFPKLVTLLGHWHWLLTLLHVGHRLLHGLQYLSLHHQDLLKGWQWWWVGSIVLIIVVLVVVSFHHLVIMERFKTYIEIKHSLLYASWYNNDWTLLRQLR